MKVKLSKSSKLFNLHFAQTICIYKHTHNTHTTQTYTHTHIYKLINIFESMKLFSKSNYHRGGRGSTTVHYLKFYRISERDENQQQNYGITYVKQVKLNKRM